MIAKATLPKNWTKAYGRLKERINCELNYFFEWKKAKQNDILTKDELLMYTFNVFSDYLSSKR